MGIFFIFLVVLHKTPATILTEEERERQRVRSILDQTQTRYYFSVYCVSCYFLMRERADMTNPIIDSSILCHHLNSLMHRWKGPKESLGNSCQGRQDQETSQQDGGQRASKTLRDRSTCHIYWVGSKIGGRGWQREGCSGNARERKAFSTFFFSRYHITITQTH